ncbi:nucleoside-diphosphate sugar epimerase/dehydratase [Dorea sp. YH-dor226]|uniref:nucleoside-diphosphate sugar epimerase/dehydratase n=1 Tax=Dorea sp. YH-dor226 TaxID=3151119 RepID=UPI0032422534
MEYNTRKEFNYQLLIRRICLIILDIACMIGASVAALLTRFEFQFSSIPEEFLDVITKYEIYFIIITLLVFLVFRIYSSLWEYAGIEEVFGIILACLLSELFKIGIIAVTWSVMPRSWYVLDVLYLMILIGGSRFVYRMARMRRHNRAFPWRKRKRVMVIGGGEAGRALIAEIQNSQYLNQQVCCIIDDDPAKQGKYIKGIKIVGGRNTIKWNVTRYNIQQIIVTIPSAGAATLRPILDICKETECELLIIPGVYQLVNGEVSVSKLRPVSIDDLLGREEIQVNLDEVMGYVSGKVIMVTGGGGSIGSELCRQLATHHPKQLIIFDIYENNAYDIQQELLRNHPELNLVVLIGSVRDGNRLESIFKKYHPELVYHAAAHKHVPLMEDSPNEAIKNNVLGTYKLVEMADRFHVKKFVQISTDKAVNPTNIMGASKRICEMIIQTYNKRSETEFVAVRFGNVLGSNGSVIPLFKKQIEHGGPVTVTHPDIIRYFMTIPEAVSLVLQAGAYAEGGEIFVLDMGEPVKILDLAKNLIRLSGLKLGQDIEIEFTGLRPGEKLYEELLMDEEGMTDTPNKLIHIGHPIDVDEDKLSYALYVLENAAERETDDMRLIVESVVPTYHPKTRGNI